jgi:hypothetical protein
MGGSLPKACVPPGQWAWLEPGGPHLEAADKALARLARQRVVLLGETHDDAEHHRWQLHTIAGLHALRPRMILAFEMFPRRVQPILDDWIAGRLTDQEFLQRTDWEKVWGYDARLYLPIFQFARMQHIPKDGSSLLVVSGRDRDALLALLRPLPHYGRQSFLIFEGATAIEQGVWPARAAAWTFRPGD